jgi:hypothetical protein
MNNSAILSPLFMFYESNLTTQDNIEMLAIPCVLTKSGS